MADEKTVDKIARELGEHKEAFLSDVNAQIREYILSKSSADCLTIVEKRDMVHTHGNRLRL